jgi:hypothetical protein
MGDCPWSVRFYETLMCKSIPIVQSWKHTFRTTEESKLGYRYILYDEPVSFDETIIIHNAQIFERNHLFPKLNIFTYATDLQKIKDFEDSAKIFDIHVNCIYVNEWSGFFDKIKIF